MIIGCSSKSIWVTRLLFCQNDSPMRGSFWEKDSLITHILFELQPIFIFSPVTNFGNQSLIYLQTFRYNFFHLFPLLTFNLLLWHHTNSYFFYTVKKSKNYFIHANFHTFPSLNLEFIKQKLSFLCKRKYFESTSLEIKTNNG